MKGPILNGVAMGALRPGVVAVRKQRCENCAFFEDGLILGMKTKVCKGGPPSALLVPAGQDQNGNPRMNIVAIWPPPPPSEWCATWKPKILGAMQSADAGEQAQP